MSLFSQAIIIWEKLIEIKHSKKQELQNLKYKIPHFLKIYELILLCTQLYQLNKKHFTYS